MRSLATLPKNSISLHDNHFDNQPIDLPLDVLLGKTPKMTRDVQTLKAKGDALNRADITIADAVKRVLHLPTVAEKTFLVTIGDRTVTGMVARDQMVGPWQVPVADCAVTTASLDSYYGEAMSIMSARRWRCWILPPPPVWPSVKR